MKNTIGVLVLLLVLSTQLSWGQRPIPRHQAQGRHHQPQMMGDFFPPEMVMRYQQKIGLSNDQQKYISVEMQQAQTIFTELQWTLHREMEKMNQITNQENVKEKEAIAQLEKILNLEKQIKRQQLMLMIRIKNKLTNQQKAALRKLKPKARHRR
ncbi:hypothetical protein BKI52_26600 [marine bacterium AO1-C]|nr:hypothetical protein BKI52_26600 [marine bacterium AO1-C]